MDEAIANSIPLLCDYIIQGVFVFLGALGGAFFAFLFDRYRERQARVKLVKSQLRQFLDIYQNPQEEAEVAGYSRELNKILDAVKFVHSKLQSTTSAVLTPEGVGEERWTYFFKHYQAYLLPEKLRSIIDNNADVLPEHLNTKLEIYWRSTVLLQMALAGYLNFYEQYIEPIYITKGKIEPCDSIKVRDYLFHLDRVVCLSERRQANLDTLRPQLESFIASM